jgi:two-component system, NtrC family, nitrogen regulation sensor histidine kinase GlnL
MAKNEAKPKKVDFKEIFDALAESIIILDIGFTVLEMNDNAESVFTISRKKARGRPSNIFLPEEVEKIAHMAIEEERTIIGDELNPVLRNGEKLSIQSVASPIFDKKGDISGVILQIKDLVGTKFLSSKSIQEISASKFENLILGLAHELKNPLSGIRGAAQLLANDTQDKEAIECAGIIIKEADRLRALLDTLKQLEPFAEEEFESLDIHEILMDIIYLESITDKRITYKQNYDVTLPPVRGNGNSLKQVFLNLIKNASQAIKGKGEVEITTRWLTEHKLKGQNSMAAEIKDSGEGIPGDSLDKIFNPFYTTKKEGSGLGLFLAYQIIAKHGGAIFVESELGEGTVVKVYLPIVG